MNSKYPKVSVIVPTFNRSSILIKTLESILTQTYFNIELIIVDDGSTDNTSETIKELVNCYKEKSIKYYYQSNQGAPTARNHGIRKATGEYLIFFDSDDLMHVNRIEKQIEVIQNNDICACGFQYSNNNKVYIPPNISDNALELFLKNELYGSTQSWMFSSKIVSEVGGYDEDLSCFQDLDLVFRVLCLNPTISISKEILSTFNNHNDDVRISSFGDSKKGLNSVYKSHLKRIKYFEKNFNNKLVQIEIKEFLTLINRNIKIHNFKTIHIIFFSTLRIVPLNQFKLILFILFVFLKELSKGFINIIKNTIFIK